MSNRKSLLMSCLALTMFVVEFWLIDHIFVTGVAPELRVSHFWVTAALLGIMFACLVLLQIVYRLARDLFFVAAAWYFRRRFPDNEPATEFGELAKKDSL